MRIAFLILAHHQPQHLLRLVGQINGKDSHCFVHVDRKHHESMMTHLTHLGERTTILSRSESRSINWCGFSMVAATLALLRASVRSGHFDRFVLLSGSDYLIQDRATMLKVLGADAEYLQIDRRLSPRGDSHFDRCANHLFLGDVEALSLRGPATLPRRFARAIERRWSTRTPATVPVYYGPSWWCLTHGAVREILQLIDERPRLLKWFRLTRSPDEMFFQTFAMLTSRRDHIAYKFHEVAAAGHAEPDRHALHYVNWRDPNPFNPRTLTMKDLPGILASEAVFARKFDEASSKQLIDAIDRRRHGSGQADDAFA